MHWHKLSPMATCRTDAWEDSSFCFQSRAGTFVFLVRNMDTDVIWDLRHFHRSLTKLNLNINMLLSASLLIEIHEMMLNLIKFALISGRFVWKWRRSQYYFGTQICTHWFPYPKEPPAKTTFELGYKHPIPAPVPRYALCESQLFCAGNIHTLQ